MAKANRSDSRWTTLPFKTKSYRADPLGLESKSDSLDSSRNLVRGERFSDSFMMATNGGATYEDAVKVMATGQRAARPLLSPSPSQRLPGPRVLGLQNETGVFGDDDRDPVDDTSRIPARSIGLLKITPEVGEMRYGTAWLIGPRTLATAAHNLVHPEAGQTVSVEVGLAYDGSAARGGWHKIVDNAFPQAWLDNPSPGNPNDYAVLKIENAEIGNRLGWFGYADYDDGKFDNMIVNIFGYPMNVAQRFHMYAAAGRVTNFDDQRVYYDCDAGGGVSGAPLIARFGEQRIAVGIHVAAGAQSNVATRLTHAVYDLFERHKSW